MDLNLNSSRGRYLAPALTLALATGIVLLGCAAEEASESTATSQDLSRDVADAVAVIELDGESYSFTQATCDLNDQNGDDILAQARGTAPDGRRMTLEVERRQTGEMVHERVTLYFGSIVEGDQWHARASGNPGGTWAAATAAGEPLDGPLIVVHGDDMTAEGSFVHETREEERAGALRVHCGG